MQIVGPRGGAGDCYYASRYLLERNTQLAVRSRPNRTFSMNTAMKNDHNYDG